MCLKSLRACVLASVVCSSITAQEIRSSPWSSVDVPAAWRKMPSGRLTPIGGYSWYRCLVKIPADWRGDRITLHVEALDDARATYLGGRYVGSTGTFPPQFRSGLGEFGEFDVPEGTIRFGAVNTIAIRVYQSDPRSNFNVAPPVLINHSDRQGMRLSGRWDYRPGNDPTWAHHTDAELASLVRKTDKAREFSLFEQVDAVSDVEQYVALREGDHPVLSPHDAEASFTTPDDLNWKLVLSEPDIAQPLFIDWDERGRLWVMEYRQYPDPAGLRMVSRDVYLRTVYDQIPKPPPHHTPGRDRISIHEDTNGDGIYDKHKVFVDGLNIATSFAKGRGGVWVTNPPYLLFYPDRNNDDQPDGDPVVHLEGFGLEDSHSVINSLRFGPDGWLYAAQGSTVTASVRQFGSLDEPIRTVGQQIWRYHPERRKFEVFAEGGGNTFGVEIDAKGRIYSGHNGGNTRGFHYIQGSYSRKGFGKHGALSNPYAFGYFEQMKHHDVERFTHNFVIYEAELLPTRYVGKLFGIEPIQGRVVMSSLEPYQSSFETRDIQFVVDTKDQWFRPVDIKVGPDGGIYVADMVEQRIDHSSHYAGRIDRSNGRVYRLAVGGDSHEAVPDIGTLSGHELTRLLRHPNKWYRQTAKRVLGDRRDASLRNVLLEQLRATQGQLALESLWALHACGGLSDQVALEMLGHPDAFVRAWTVRLVCDAEVIGQEMANALAELSLMEPYIQVRKQLAASSRRLPPAQALPIVRNLVSYDQDSTDVHQPLLLWWALEQQANEQGRRLITSQLLSDKEIWRRPLFSRHLMERLMKRYALSATRAELAAAAELLMQAPNKVASSKLLSAFESAFSGRSLAELPEELVVAIAQVGGGSLALRVRQRSDEAVVEAVRLVGDQAAGLDERRGLVELFGELALPESVSALKTIVATEMDATLVSAALTALQAFDDDEIGKFIVKHLKVIPSSSIPVAQTALASRKHWTLQLLLAIGKGTVASDAILPETIHQMLVHDHNQLKHLLDEYFGDVVDPSDAALAKEMQRVTLVLLEGSGNPKQGKSLYMNQCGKCHKLFESGGNVGPELTPYQRSDLRRLLTNVIHPSAEIREGFENHLIVSSDGQVVSGFLADEDSRVVVLRGIDGQNWIFSRDEIDELRRLPRSVMPTGTLDGLSDQQLRDLFAYLRSSQPVNY